MNKRSATLIAAALVAVLAVGGAAFSLGLTGPTADAATEIATTAGQKPIVRTRTATVTVHRQADTAAAQVARSLPSSSGSSASPGSGDEDDGDGHEGIDDHGDQGDIDVGDDEGRSDD